MHTIIHTIRLLPGTTAEQFEAWVREHDYTSCPELSSIVAFAVHRAPAPAPFDYFEVIQVSSRRAFEDDMTRPAFAALVDRFTTMATVVDELSGERIEPGYCRAM